MTASSQRWGAAVTGHKFDLQDWADDLKGPFEPYVLMVARPDSPPVTTLVGGDLRHCSTSEEAYVIAVSLVRRLSGLIGAHRNADRVQFDGIIEFMPDGSFVHHKYATASFRGRSRFSARGTAVGGSPMPPEASYAQLALSTTSQALLDALEHFDRADNWPDLYKAFEALKSHVGDMTQLKALGFSGKKLDLFSHTANSLFRHDRSATQPPPSQPMEFREAKRLIADIIKAAKP